MDVGYKPTFTFYLCAMKAWLLTLMVPHVSAAGLHGWACSAVLWRRQWTAQRLLVFCVSVVQQSQPHRHHQTHQWETRHQAVCMSRLRGNVQVEAQPTETSEKVPGKIQSETAAAPPLPQFWIHATSPASWKQILSQLKWKYLVTLAVCNMQQIFSWQNKLIVFSDCGITDSNKNRKLKIECYFLFPSFSCSWLQQSQIVTCSFLLVWRYKFCSYFYNVCNCKGVCHKMYIIPCNITSAVKLTWWHMA